MSGYTGQKIIKNIIENSNGHCEITASGDTYVSNNIGIGTASPSEKLDVDGNVSTTGTLSAATGSTIGNLTLANGSITDSSGTITFGDENLNTTGNVGIGTASPVGRLDVVNDSSNPHMYMYAYGQGQGYLHLGTDSSGTSNGRAFRKILMYVSDYFSGDSQMYFVRNNSWKSWNGIASDSRIKQNQTEFPTTESLDIVKSIKVKEYYNTQLEATVKGFIAQEVESVLPEAVTTDDLSEYGGLSDFKFLDYRRLLVHSFGAIQSLEQTINELKSRIEALESQ